MRPVKRLPFVPAEDDILRRFYANSRAEDIAKLINRSLSSVYQRARRLGLEKAPEFAADTARKRWQEGRHDNSRKCHFRKGLVPANKGRPMAEWMSPEGIERSKRGRFKKGSMSGAAQHNYVPIGSTRIVYGNLERKVTDDPSLYPAKRWKPVHRIVWEAANGPVPRGHLVVFRPGRHTAVEGEITLDRLELITRAENMRRNSYHTRYPKDVAQLIQLKGALNRKINRRMKNREEQDD